MPGKLHAEPSQYFCIRKIPGLISHLMWLEPDRVSPLIGAVPGAAGGIDGINRPHIVGAAADRHELCRLIEAVGPTDDDVIVVDRRAIDGAIVDVADGE